MKLKALLLCEDIRLEMGGTVTLVGVFNERLIAPPGQGAIELAKLSFVAVIAGLRGVEQIKYRQWIGRPGAEGAATELVTDAHAPTNDEHNFVFTESPMVFPEVGTYEIGLDVEVAGRRESHRYQFTVARAARGA